MVGLFFFTFREMLQVNLLPHLEILHDFPHHLRQKSRALHLNCQDVKTLLTKLDFSVVLQ